jgi:hypothetical protein
VNISPYFINSNLVILNSFFNRISKMQGYTSLMLPKKAIVARFNQSPSSTNSRVVSTSAAKWDVRYTHNPPHTTDFYLKCCVGGVLSCGLTHLAVTPLDVAKCNMKQLTLVNDYMYDKIKMSKILNKSIQVHSSVNKKI